MNRDERRTQNRTVREKDTRTGDGARQQTVTIPSSEGAEESKQDPYRDEGGES
jgi:hypothetical protein